MPSSNDLRSPARYAALVAPWTVVPMVALALKGGPHLSRLELFLSGLLMGTLFGVPITYLAVLLVGYPAYKALLALDLLNVWSLLAIGASAGALSGLLFVGSEAILLCGVCGFVVSLTAWLLIRRELAIHKSKRHVASTVA